MRIRRECNRRQGRERNPKLSVRDISVSCSHYIFILYLNPNEGEGVTAAEDEEEVRVTFPVHGYKKTWKRGRTIFLCMFRQYRRSHPRLHRNRQIGRYGSLTEHVVAKDAFCLRKSSNSKVAKKYPKHSRTDLAVEYNNARTLICDPCLVASLSPHYLRRTYPGLKLLRCGSV